MEPSFAHHHFAPVLEGVRESSRIMILDFHQLHANIPAQENIRSFFTSGSVSNPRSPESRQQFNETFLAHAQVRYLIGRYAENRHEMLRGSQIAAEGRTYHLGIDLFCANLEPVFAPADGVVVSADYEEGDHTYGHYVILRHVINQAVLYSLFGHLGKDLPSLGSPVTAGEKIATLGDWTNNENGGWSRHLHFQLMTEAPQRNGTPIGYSTKENLAENMRRFPNPNALLRLLALTEPI